MAQGAKTPAGKACTVVGAIIVAITLVLALLMALPSMLGWQQLVVLTGSMEPAIPVGSMVYVQPTDSATLAQGDVVTYVANGSEVTHRVEANNATEGQLTTKGDANEQADPLPVPYSAVVGKVAFSVPVLGDLLGFFGGTMGKIYLVAFGACGLMLAILGGRPRKPAPSA